MVLGAVMCVSKKFFLSSMSTTRIIDDDVTAMKIFFSCAMKKYFFIKIFFIKIFFYENIFLVSEPMILRGV
jgi:hypothetical protein